jgi:predicted Zn-dependent peptidase
MDEVFMESLAAPSKKKANVLKDRLDMMQTEASQLAMSNAFGSLLMREGAVGLNAATSHDSTKYYCSMPSNKIELWFALEAERFQAPVFRDVYSEKKVVLEERRLRVDSSPLGRFQEKFAEESLTNNYRRPVIGYEEDIERIGRRDVASFFKDKYGPESLTVAIVGDVSPSKVRQYAEKYFGGWRREVTRTARCNGYEREPLAAPAEGRSRVMTASSKAGPLLVRAWYRPCIRNQSASLALDAMDDFLTGSRSSRTYRNLVEKSTALSVSTYATYPGEKHATQMLCYAIPAPGVSFDTLDTSLQREVEYLLEKGPSEEELMQYKKSSSVGILGITQTNSSMASALSVYENLTGSWRNIYRELDEISRLNSYDIRTTASQYLTPSNSFVAYISR